MTSVVLRATVDQAAFQKCEADLLRLPFELRTKVISKATKGSAKVFQEALAKELRANLNSLLTGSREKQSQKVKSNRPEHHLFETVVIRGAAYGELEIAVAGPSWPGGNLVNFYVSSYTHPSWGHDPQIAVGPKAYDIAARVAAQVEPQVQAEFMRIMRKGSAEELAKLV